MEDLLKIKGVVTIKNLNTGEIKVFENLVTSGGFNNYADRIMNNAVPFIDYLGVGDGVGTHTVTSTQLYNEIFRKIVDSKANPGNTATFNFLILGDEAIGSWTELGMFNDGIAGIMTNVVELTYTHIAGDNLELKWEIFFN